MYLRLHAVCYFCFAVLIYSASAGASEEDRSLSSNNLESEFAAVITRVQDRTLDAPEASQAYLAHWMNVYNETYELYPNDAVTLPRTQKRASESVKNLGAEDNPGASKVAEGWRPNGYPVVSPEWAVKKPFSFQSASKFRPPAPPDIDDPDFRLSLQDVRIMGDLHSDLRTPEQSLISAFWANGMGTETPPGRWNLIALENSRHLPRAKRLDILLSLNIALYDAGIAAWDSKYHYNYWRPQTAITVTFTEGFDWEPMMQPPFHPEYVSGHSAFSGAAAEILEHYLGQMDFCITAAELADLKRCYRSFGEAASEAGRSRVYGGIHFQFSNAAGLELGRGVGQHVIANINDLLSRNRALSLPEVIK